MRRYRVLTGAIVLGLTVTGLCLGRSAARDLASPAPITCSGPHACNGPVFVAGQPQVGFKVRATKELLRWPAYDACLARIDAADALATICLGDSGPWLAGPRRGIALVSDSLAQGFHSALQQLVGSTAPTVPTTPGLAGAAKPSPKPGSQTKPTPQPAKPKWYATLLTGWTCWYGTCRYTCENWATCSVKITCYAATCQYHHTCKPSTTPQGCEPAGHTGGSTTSLASLLR